MEKWANKCSLSRLTSIHLWVRPTRGKSDWRGRLSMIDLLAPTSLDQLLFILKTLLSYLQNNLTQWGGQLSWLPPMLVFPSHRYKMFLLLIHKFVYKFQSYFMALHKWICQPEWPDWAIFWQPNSFWKLLWFFGKDEAAQNMETFQWNNFDLKKQFQRMICLMYF